MEILNIIKDMIFKVDLEGNFLFINETMCNVLKYSKEELMNMNYFSIIHPDDIPNLMIIKSEPLKPQGIKNLEFRYLTKKGNIINVQANLSPTFDKLGKIINVVGVAREISVKINKLKKISEEQKKIQMYLDFAAVMIIAINSHGTVTLANKKACKILGYTKKEIIGKNWFDYFLPKRLISEIKSVSKKLFSGEIEPIEYFENPIITKSGKEKIIAWHNAILKNDFGEIIGHISSGSDISNRIKMENDLLKKKKEMQLLLDNINTQIWYLTDPVTYGMVNQAHADFNGVTKNFLEYKNLNDIYPKEIVEASKASNIEVFEKKIPVYIEQWIPNKNGEKILIGISKTPMLNKNGEVDYIVCDAQDITERKRAENERLKSQKLDSISLLAGGIAHDFNNILVSILGNVDLMQLEENINDELKESLKDIKNAAIRARDLTNQLLTFSKGGAPVKKNESIEKIISESISFIMHGRNSKCSLHLEENLPMVEVDASQINQVINNLIINANQAMPQGGFIDIDVSTINITDNNKIPLIIGQYLKIKVKDTGSGIPKKLKNKIFEPYFTTKAKGTGLGLATSYSIIRRHKGNITFTSEEGKGTIFKVYLPVKKKNLKQ